MMSGFDSTTAKSSMRPPIVAGPISRNLSDLKTSLTSAAIATEAMKRNTTGAVTFLIVREKYYRRGCPGVFLRLGLLFHRVPQGLNEDEQQQEDAQSEGNDEEDRWAPGRLFTPDALSAAGHRLRYITQFAVGSTLRCSSRLTAI